MLKCSKISGFTNFFKQMKKVAAGDIIPGECWECPFCCVRSGFLGLCFDERGRGDLEKRGHWPIVTRFDSCRYRHR